MVISQLQKDFTTLVESGTLWQIIGLYHKWGGLSMDCSVSYWRSQWMDTLQGINSSLEMDFIVVNSTPNPPPP